MWKIVSSELCQYMTTDAPDVYWASEMSKAQDWVTFLSFLPLYLMCFQDMSI